jgi:LemA protein
MTLIYVVIALVVAVALLVAFSYNGLVRLRNKVSEAWRDVDVQLQRRHDLVPKLVEIVKGYAEHEREVFEELARARVAAQEAGEAAARSEPETLLAGALARALAVAEAYPTLRASENFLSLQKEIAHTEDEIAAARFIYNGNVRIYNTRIQSFPSSLYASQFGFEPAGFFQAEAGQ